MSTHKPTNVDAQRILSIMDELKEKLTFLSVIQQGVLESMQSDENSSSVDLLGPELMKMFSEQIRLEELYVVNNTNSEGQPVPLEEDNGGVSEDVKQLQKNTSEICRKMKGVQNIVAELRNHQETRPAGWFGFVKTLADMQELMLKRLTTTVEEDRSRQELLETYNMREQEASKRRAQLEKDLLHIRRERERANSLRQDQLTKLKADLLDVNTAGKDRMNELRERYTNRMKGDQEDWNKKKEDLTKKIDALKDSNKKLIEQYGGDEGDQKRAVKRNEREVAEVIDKYDTGIKEIVDNILDETDGYRKDDRHLLELKDHFVKVDEEKMCIDHEEGLTQARLGKFEAEKKRRDASSALVQAFWRGIRQRDEYQDMKKKLKKGKKGGKKKAK